MSATAVGHLEHLLLALTTAAAFAAMVPVGAWLDRLMGGREW